MKVEKQIEELGLTLPAVHIPIGNYVNVVRSGNLLFVATHSPEYEPGKTIKGKLGDNLGVAEGNAAAKQAALCILATLKNALGDLDRVKRIIKMVGYINCTIDFIDHPKVLNGASDLFVKLYGENGRHARVGVGASSMPTGIALAIELIVEVTN
jgi:enamine deaminase RidA (YjgF/YER057c/UK114 family)